ncbi:MAG TPA: DUF4292 domain-containing protein [Chitinophagaceae bacterium]|nr:DUF4292 domain-containing protein [Chitinophagaceae bacterium]
MKYILPLMVLMIVASCRSAKKIQTALGSKDSTTVILNPLESDSAKKVLGAYEKIKSNRIEFNTFSSKLVIDYKGLDKDGKERKINNLGGVIRMQRDSVIWISLQAPIIGEVMRVKITPDTVSIMDKQNNTVQYKPFSYLQETAKLPIQFADLQDLLIGNPIFLDSNIVSYEERENLTSLTTLGKEFKNFSSFILPGLNLQRTKLDDVDITTSRSADLLYDGYEQNGTRMFPGKRKITVAYKTVTEVGLEFKQLQFDTPVNFPFSVPDKYKLK